MNINSLMYFLLNKSETSKTELPVKLSTTENKTSYREHFLAGVLINK